MQINMESFPTWHLCNKVMPEEYTDLIEYDLKCSEFTPYILVVFPNYHISRLCRKRTINEADFKWVSRNCACETPKTINKNGEPIMWTFFPSKSELNDIYTLKLK